MTETKQAKLLRSARDAMGMTNEELAAKLGVSYSTMRNWLYPKTSKAHRQMPEMAKKLLGHVLAEHRAKGRK